MKSEFVATEKLREIILDKLGWTNQIFAKKFGIDESRASRILNGKEEPSKNLSREIHQELSSIFMKQIDGLFEFTIISNA